MLHQKIVLTVIAFLPAVTLCAQLELPPPSTAAVAIQVKPHVVEADKMLASWLMAGCNNEVAIARIGVRKAQNVDVKKFAEKMLAEHAELATKLLPFTGFAAKVVNADGAPTKISAIAKKAEAKPADASSSPIPVTKREFDHTALIHDLSKRLLESQAKMLEDKSGADFDESFMHALVGLHTKSVIKVEVFGNYASDDLRPTLKLAGTTLRTHLEQAMALCKKCDNASNGGDKPSGSQK